ncbi:hypothetical protein GCM10010245_52490 [Streptomyces spectabilis]|nr:hypothetical protein GCM10010245_52490 [Streptomyces spectabilis]
MAVAATMKAPKTVAATAAVVRGRRVAERFMSRVPLDRFITIGRVPAPIGAGRARPVPGRRERRTR